MLNIGRRCFSIDRTECRSGVGEPRGTLAAVFAFTLLAVPPGFAGFFLLVIVAGDLVNGQPFGVEKLLWGAALAATSAVIGLFGRWYLRRTAARFRSGTMICFGCGYDLRSSHGCCPECGRAIPGDADELMRRLARGERIDDHRDLA